MNQNPSIELPSRRNLEAWSQQLIHPARSVAQADVYLLKDSAGNEIILKIYDSGIGIPPENMDKIFSPFFTTRTNGSGIGLSICQRIITHHDGTIDVSSSPGSGAEFIIRLPVEKRAIKR